MENEVSMTNLLLMGLRTYLSKMNDGEKDVTVRNYVSRRSTLLNKTSGRHAHPLLPVPDHPGAGDRIPRRRAHDPGFAEHHLPACRF